MKKLMMAAVAALACVAMAQEAGDAGAKRPGPPRRDGMQAMEMVVRMVMNKNASEEFGLSAEQREKLLAFDAQVRESTKANQIKLRSAMERQASLMKADKIDEAEVMSAIDDVFEIRKTMAKAQTKRIIEVKSILTPEQIQKALDAMKKQREARRQMRKSPVAAAARPAEKKTAPAASAK